MGFISIVYSGKLTVWAIQTQNSRIRADDENVRS